MYKDSKRTCTAIVLLIKPFVWWRSRCRRRRGLLKLPILIRGRQTNSQVIVSGVPSHHEKNRDAWSQVKGAEALGTRIPLKMFNLKGSKAGAFAVPFMVLSWKYNRRWSFLLDMVPLRGENLLTYAHQTWSWYVLGDLFRQASPSYFNGSRPWIHILISQINQGLFTQPLVVF